MAIPTKMQRKALRVAITEEDTQANNAIKKQNKQTKLIRN